MRIFFCILLFLNIFSKAEEITLLAGGKIVTKEHEQKLGPTCSATRKWIEIDGLADKAVQNKINHSIQKEITVGKKLSARDCLLDKNGNPKFPQEKIDFFNSVSLSGQRPSTLGISTYVYFPGGTGRRYSKCSIFNLKTGEKFDLGSYVTKPGEQVFAKAICDQIKIDFKDDAKIIEKYCGDFSSIKTAMYSNLEVCLKDSGIELSFRTHNQSSTHVKIDPDNAANAIVATEAFGL